MHCEKGTSAFNQCVSYLLKNVWQRWDCGVKGTDHYQYWDQLIESYEQRTIDLQVATEHMSIEANGTEVTC